jgi:UDP-N-acetylmuramoylalanine--D-glutamate ligase
VDGINFYDDSASTTPETAIAAIKAFSQKKVVILGGSSKKANFAELGREVAVGNVRAVILIGQEARRLKDALEKAAFAGELVEARGQIEDIVKNSKEKAKGGDVVLLSPACASFDMFKNYSDRGEKFKQAVFQL